MNFFWRAIDPLLLKMRSRLEHLARHEPSRAHDELARSLAVIDAKAIVAPTARIQSVAARDQLRIGAFTWLEGEILLLTSNARCALGDYCFLGKDSRLWVQSSMTIGNHVLIAPQVDIFDNDSHPLDASLRREDAVDMFERKRPMNYANVAASPVVIEDDVWIGAKSTIMKGVRIGRGAVVAAASVVTKDVAPFTLVAGNPAREIKSLA